MVKSIKGRSLQSFNYLGGSMIMSIKVRSLRWYLVVLPVHHTVKSSYCFIPCIMDASQQERAASAAEHQHLVEKELRIKKKADKEKDTDMALKKWTKQVTLNSIALSEDWGRSCPSIPSLWNH